MAEAAMHGGVSCHCALGGPQCSTCQASSGVVRRKPRSGDSTSGANLVLGAARPLGDGERSFFESRYQADFSDVRVHDNNEAASSAALINARAFTIGSDIVFGSNEFHFDTMAGQLLLAHELAHVLQQQDRRPRHTSFAAVSTRSATSLQKRRYSNVSAKPRENGSAVTGPGSAVLIDRPVPTSLTKPEALVRSASASS